ncbi:MAG: serine/threonine protein kinase [bacterium]|nr:serine/threonine protein kinase [bacterium]
MDAKEIISGIAAKYELLELIGKGGFAEVYRVKDKQLERDVAIKILSHRHTGDYEVIERFGREARLYANLEHKHLIPIYNTGAIDNHVYMIMKFIDGDNLDSLLDLHGKLPMSMIKRILSSLCDVLDYIHGKGIVHRDIKPSNILIEKESRFIFLADFGIARSHVDETITETGIIMGTPHYISPELAKGSQVDHRSDIYAVGSMLYHLIAGKPVFSGTSSIDILMQHAQRCPTPLSQVAPDTDPGIALIVNKCLEKDPALRFQDVKEINAVLNMKEAPLSTLSATQKISYSTNSSGISAHNEKTKRPALLTNSVSNKNNSGLKWLLLLLALAVIFIYVLISRDGGASDSLSQEDPLPKSKQENPLKISPAPGTDSEVPEDDPEDAPQEPGDTTPDGSTSEDSYQQQDTAGVTETPPSSSKKPVSSVTKKSQHFRKARMRQKLKKKKNPNRKRRFNRQ